MPDIGTLLMITTFSAIMIAAAASWVNTRKAKRDAAQND